ncbi:MAG TPA: YebC/PmpR family DNA-binding transcriptional regulator [Ignavibacteria bacterium]|nr:YebC/PmpR family DNA-binding transcriptional regulator [Ignavibacteria bacterium]HQY52298.1 YebC/PmpR family DNA-binding transcriptional regulator [Ignavibacteria bacterium]HRA99882.1 YebC/PmpR family DNA-binding transcriptional regulator [Ignavibacteria bacterium]
MSGHSKWATIKRKKAATDSARGRVFTKIIKEITIAARDGGGDPDGNPRLRLAIQTAKANNMPQDNITRGIKKGTGELEGVRYEEITYEAYAPNGIAMIIESVTDNKNRTVADLRHGISKAGGNLGESGSVAWMFERKGVVNVEKGDIKEDDLMEIILDAGAEDLKSEGEYFEVVTPIENFETVRKAIEDKSFVIESASLQYIAKDLLPVEGKNADAVIRCIEAVEDNDDVQNVFTNADFLDE